MSVVQEMAHLFAPWQQLYSDSTVVSTTVTALHIVSLLGAGGLAIASDRAALRVIKRPLEERRAFVRELNHVHLPVLLGLGILFVTGIMLGAADIETYAASTVFYIKLGLVLLLLVNGTFLYFTGSRLAREGTEPNPAESGLWWRLRATSIVSLTLWFATSVVGVLLTSAA